MRLFDLEEKKIGPKPIFKDPKDNPENCPICGSKLEFAHMVPACFCPEHPEFRCTKCKKYFTNPFLDANAKLIPEEYAYFAAKENKALVKQP